MFVLVICMKYKIFTYLILLIDEKYINLSDNIFFITFICNLFSNSKETVCPTSITAFPDFSK